MKNILEFGLHRFYAAAYGTTNSQIAEYAHQYSDDPLSLRIIELFADQPYLGSYHKLDETLKFLDSLITRDYGDIAYRYRYRDVLKDQNLAKVLLANGVDHELRKVITKKTDFVGELCERRYDLALSLLKDRREIHDYYSVVPNDDLSYEVLQLRNMLDRLGIDKLLEIRPGLYLPLQVKNGPSVLQFTKQYVGMGLRFDTLDYLLGKTADISYRLCNERKHPVRINIKRNIPVLCEDYSIGEILKEIPKLIERSHDDFPLVELDKAIEDYSEAELMYKLLEAKVVEVENPEELESRLRAKQTDEAYLRESHDKLSVQHKTKKDLWLASIHEANFLKFGAGSSYASNLEKAYIRLKQGVFGESCLDQVSRDMALENEGLNSSVEGVVGCREWLARLYDPSARLKPFERAFLSSLENDRRKRNFSYENFIKLKKTLALAMAADSFTATDQLISKYFYPLKMIPDDSERESDFSYDSFFVQNSSGSRLIRRNPGYTHFLAFDPKSTDPSHRLYLPLSISNSPTSRIMLVDSEQKSEILASEPELAEYFQPEGERHKLAYFCSCPVLQTAKGDFIMVKRALQYAELLEEIYDNMKDYKFFEKSEVDAMENPVAIFLNLYKAGYIKPESIS